MTQLAPIVLLFCSNVFMTFAWYGQLKFPNVALWQVVQIADWNNDGKVDLVFRNATTGLIFVWYTNGIALQGSDFITQIDPSWKLVPYR